MQGTALDQVFETLAVHQFHKYDELITLFTKVIERRDIRMVKSGLEAGFVKESSFKTFVLSRSSEYFDGCWAAELIEDLN